MEVYQRRLLNTSDITEDLTAKLPTHMRVLFLIYNKSLKRIFIQVKTELVVSTNPQSQHLFQVGQSTSLLMTSNKSFNLLVWWVLSALPSKSRMSLNPIAVGCSLIRLAIKIQSMSIMLFWLWGMEAKMDKTIGLWRILGDLLGVRMVTLESSEERTPVDWLLAPLTRMSTAKLLEF